VSLERLLRVLTEALSSAGIPSMLTGSLAAAFHGASRATMDVDLVIAPTAATLHVFVQRVEALGLFVSADAAREALAHQGMFNVVDPETGWKADLSIRQHRPFSEAEFSRREATDLLGVPLAIASLEDVILSKLEWARLGASGRQLDDVRTPLRIAGDSVDRSYLERWVAALGVREEWKAVKE
jgi:hypothetical protein